MIEVKPVVEDIEKLVMKTFLKSIEILGGPRRLIEYRNLTWLPSLMEACYAVILRDRLKTEDKIARMLGLTRQTVRKMLQSDEKIVLKRIKGVSTPEEFKEHIAGGIAKLAWKEVKEGRFDVESFIENSREALEAVEAPTWAIHTLVRIKGLDFPVDKALPLKERLKGIKAYGVSLEEVLEGVEYPVRSPAELLKKLSARLREVKKDR